jgi:hypothetical protein
MFILFLVMIVPIAPITYAQTIQMKKPTSGGSLDVLLNPSSFRVNSSEPARLNVIFFEHGTDKIQQHIDYNLIIKHEQTDVFNASKQLNQPTLHTAEGVVSIPYKFTSQGSYLIWISVLGIDLFPIEPEYVDFLTS